jgi:HEAT repeat protein
MLPAVEDLNHTQTRVRIETADAFMQTGTTALPTLLAALEHPALEVRWRAAAAAGWIGSPEAIPAIIQLCHDNVYESQFNCTWALGQIGDSAAIPYLLDVLHGGEEIVPDIRYNAALALARLGSTEVLRDALKDTSHPTYRVAHAALGAARYF